MFSGFNGIRTHGLCVSAAVLHQLSYEDPYVGNEMEWNIWILCELRTYEWNEDVIIAVVITIQVIAN